MKLPSFEELKQLWPNHDITKSISGYTIMKLINDDTGDQIMWLIRLEILTKDPGYCGKYYLVPPHIETPHPYASRLTYKRYLETALGIMITPNTILTGAQIKAAKPTKRIGEHLRDGFLKKISQGHYQLTPPEEPYHKELRDDLIQSMTTINSFADFEFMMKLIEIAPKRKEHKVVYDLSKTLKEFDMLEEIWRRDYRQYAFPTFLYSIAGSVKIVYADYLTEEDMKNIAALYKNYNNLHLYAPAEFTDDDVALCREFFKKRYFDPMGEHQVFQKVFDDAAALFLCKGGSLRYEGKLLEDIHHFNTPLWRMVIKEELANPYFKQGGTNVLL